MSPNILEVMSFRLGVFYPVTATTAVCCILMQILCVVSQKKHQLLGDDVPQTHYRGSAPIPARGLPSPDLQSSFMSPNNPTRLTTLLINIAALHYFRHALASPRGEGANGGSCPPPNCLQTGSWDYRKFVEKFFGQRGEVGARTICMKIFAKNCIQIS